MKNIPKIYIDFDRTLFDTDGFGLEVKKLREKYNINDETWKSYEKKYRNNNNNCFNMFHIIYDICHNENIDYDILNELNNLIINECDKYIYPDAIVFLKQLKQLNLECYMLTFGDYDFQGRKVFNTCLPKYFNEIIVTDVNKFNIPEKIDYENGLFLDDNPRDVEGIYEQKPYDIIRIRRNNVKYSDIDLKYSDIKEYNNLNELNVKTLTVGKKKFYS